MLKLHRNATVLVPAPPFMITGIIQAVIVAMKNKMDLAMGVAVGSGIQIAL